MTCVKLKASIPCRSILEEAVRPKLNSSTNATTNADTSTNP
jgi:hypothetical protein